MYYDYLVFVVQMCHTIEVEQKMMSFYNDERIFSIMHLRIQRLNLRHDFYHT